MVNYCGNFHDLRLIVEVARNYDPVSKAFLLSESTKGDTTKILEWLSEDHNQNFHSDNMN